MLNDRELLQQALDALKHLCLHTSAIKGYDGHKVQPAIKAIKARLAQPEETVNGWPLFWPLFSGIPQPEPKIINMEAFVGSGKPVVPVCWMNANDIDKTDWKVWAHGKPTVSMPLFASPPKKEWVGLTDEELTEMRSKVQKYTPMDSVEYGLTIQCAMEAKLKEKNGMD